MVVGYSWGTTGNTRNWPELYAELYRRQAAGEAVRIQSFSGDSAGRTEYYIVPDTGRAGAPIQSTPTQATVVTGIDPSEIHNALYGKIIPLSALGLARIGTAGLIFGPYFESGAASFAVSFGFPANPLGTRRVYEVSLDSKVAWELAAGSPAGDLGAGGFLSDPFTCRFYSGTQTQPADPLEIARFGDEAVAYRPQMMLWFENLPLEQFDGKVPFVSLKVGEVTDGAVPGDGINLGEALERFAYSPWLEYDGGSFETAGVADIVQAMILTEDQSFLDLLRVTARVYRTLDILQTDKLRVMDRGSTVEPDLTLQRDHIANGAGVQYVRREESSVPRELELITIDPDADYVFMPTKAARPRVPVPVTSSVAKDTISLPVVVGATTRASLVTYAKYQEDNARKRVSLQTMLHGYALEPGDLFSLNDIANGFDNGEVYKVVESSHGANYINEIAGEAILKCSIAFVDEADPYFALVLLLLHLDSGPPVIDSSQYVETMTTFTAGDMTIDSSVRKFGTASVLVEGDADRLRTVSVFEGRWDISPTNTSPFTIELWARCTAVPLFGVNQTLVCRNNAFAGRLWHLYIAVASTEVTWTWGSPATAPNFTDSIITVGANLVMNTWFHIAVDKDSTGKLRIYINGVMKVSETPADSTILNGTAPIEVGNSIDGAEFNGNIDDVRITKISRYGDLYGDASFPVPTAAFPDHA